MVEENPPSSDWAVAGVKLLPWVPNYNWPVRFVQGSSQVKTPKYYPLLTLERGLELRHHLWNRQDDGACLELTQLSMYEKFQGLLTTTFISLHSSLPPHLRAVECTFQNTDRSSRTNHVLTKSLRVAQALCVHPGLHQLCAPTTAPTIPPQSLSLLKPWIFLCV